MTATLPIGHAISARDTMNRPVQHRSELAVAVLRMGRMTMIRQTSPQTTQQR